MNIAPRISILTLFTLSSVASIASADTITGHVVSSTGAPVAGVDINAFRVSNGNEEKNLSNDGTNANGDFVTTIPPGVYDLQFVPPAPPATSHVTLVLHNVVVTGTKALGTLTLPPGYVLSGHVQNQSGQPNSQVTLQVIDEVTGNDVPLAFKRPNAFGNFSIAVPRNAIELRYDATNVTPVTASQNVRFTPVADTNLGTVVLQPGLRVTGHVQRSSNGTAVPTVDLDFTNRTTGQGLFTPNDNTDALGNFSVVVPSGRFNIDFCAPTAQRLVGVLLPNRLITADTNLGTVAMDPGFVLSGTIRSFDGGIEANADVDVEIQSSRAKVNTCADNSNASGFYSVLVPAGNLRVIFHPPTFLLGLASDVHTNFLVSADTTLNGTLPVCNPPVNYGSGLAGTGGFVPHLSSSGGVPASGNTGFAYELSGGRGGATASLIISLDQRSVPALGGTLLVNPSRSRSVKVNVVLGGTPGAGGAGTARVLIPFEIGLLAGSNVYAQFAVHDPLASQGWALSDGLRFLVGP